MFSMSLKSVPFCFVLIAPMLIGVPVALTPGLVPHAEVALAALAVLVAEEEAAGAELLAAGALDDPVLAGGEEVVELELHAARTPSDSAATAAAAVRVLQWKDLFMCSAFWWLTEKHFSSERVHGFACQATITPRS
ncbi:MAG TPA: hypothetical protein VMI73_17945 [Trebonia sp.]|nr:hypothetical protein [Trebonia sp.]